MNHLVARWGRRGALALGGMVLLGFVVGAIAKDRPAHRAGTDSAAGTAVGEVDAVRRGAAVTRQLQPAGGSTGVAGPALGAPPAPAVAGSADLPPIPDRIVRNADLGLEVKAGRFDSAWGKAFQIATRFGGFVASSNRGLPRPIPLEDLRPRGDDERRFGDVTIRVPASRFEAALAELRTIGKVTGDVVSSQDVTEEFVDLESRLRHARSQEAILLRLMAQAKSIQDTIVVQQQLSQVQLQIEELSGRLRLLRSQTDLSTINVHLAEPGAVVPAPGGGPSFGRAWDTAVEGLVRIGTTAMIAGAWLSPFALLAGIGLAARRLRARPAPQA
jgi:hypothetical protein